MEERLDRIIRKIILPQYPTIDRFIITTDRFRDMKYNFVFDRPIYKNITTYLVIYYFKSEEDLKMIGENLDDDTMSLFFMLGPEDNEEITVNYTIEK